jgi:ferritin-like metal-binding protein YciE
MSHPLERRALSGGLGRPTFVALCAWRILRDWEAHPTLDRQPKTTAHGFFAQKEDIQLTDTTIEKNQKTIADYVGDMKAVESHIEEALDRQLDMFSDLPSVAAAIKEFHDMVKAQRDHVQQVLDGLPKESSTNAVKDFGSSLLGKAAGMLDKVRTESESKALRDDYTAFNLAAVSYAMLYTTADSLGNSEVADMSKRHLRGYAGAIQKINHLIPAVVVQELTKDGHPADAAAVARANKVIDEAWQQTSN